MALLNVRWKLSDRHSSERLVSMVIETLRPSKPKFTLKFGLRAESLCRDLSNLLLSIRLLSSAMNLCIESISIESISKVSSVLLFQCTAADCKMPDPIWIMAELKRNEFCTTFLHRAISVRLQPYR